jgi:hypothetical protein
VAAVTVAAVAELTAVAATTKAVTMAATMVAIVVAAATVTATATVGCEDIGGDSDGRGHRQQSTIIGSKDMVAVGIAMETAHAGAAMTAAGAPMTAPGVGTDGIAFATAWEGCGCWL